MGDLLLKEVAHRLSNSVREMDTVSRYGGDEFTVLLSELDTDKTKSITEAGIVAEKIRVALSQPYMLTPQREGKAKSPVEHHCTSSIGVMMFIYHEMNQNDIITSADTAMYQAKQDGRNLIRFFNSFPQK